MIIVSQDETEIINFNKVDNIYVSGKFISLDFGLNNNEVIGQYATEERAKEILRKIIQCYTNTEQYKCFSNNSNENYETLNYLIKNSFIYEMPKE